MNFPVFQREIVPLLHLMGVLVLGEGPGKLGYSAGGHWSSSDVHEGCGGALRILLISFLLSFDTLWVSVKSLISLNRLWQKHNSKYNQGIFIFSALYAFTKGEVSWYRCNSDFLVSGAQAAEPSNWIWPSNVGVCLWGEKCCACWFEGVIVGLYLRSTSQSRTAGCRAAEVGSKKTRKLC